MTEPDKFQQLEELHRAGVLNDAEFNNAWAKLAAQQSSVAQPAYAPPPAPVAPAAPPNSSRHSASAARSPLIKWIVVGAAVIVAAVVLVIVQPWSSGSKGFTTQGVLQLSGVGGPIGFNDSDYEFLTNGSKCIGFNGYDDITPGTQVTVADAAGKTLALSSLEGGTAGSGTCTFTFTIRDVPPGKKFYQVTISHRGGLQFTEAEMRAGISTSLGN